MFAITAIWVTISRSEITQRTKGEITMAERICQGTWREFLDPALDDQREENQQIHQKHAEKHPVQLVDFLRHGPIVRPNVARNSNADHTKFVTAITRFRSIISIVSAGPLALLRRTHGSI